MRCGLALLVAVAVLSPAGIAAGTTQPKVTVIGDSVADQMEHSPIALESLSQGFTVDLETHACRRLATSSCTIAGSSGPPANVVRLVKDLNAKLGKIVVIDVGYNDDPARYDHDLDAVMRALRAAGVETVIWLTLREARPTYKIANRDIRVEPKEWPELVVADWNAFSALHRDWFRPDGIHPTLKGAAELGRFIHRALLRSA